MMTYLVIGAAFGGGFLLIFGLNLLLADYSDERRQAIKRRLDDEFRLQQRERARGSLAHKELYELAAQGYLDLSDRPSLGERFTKLIEQSGLSVGPVRLVVYCLISGLLAGAGTALLFRSWLLGGIGGLAAGALPALYVAFKRAQRQEKLLSQLPDAFELMSRVLRAGQTMSQSLQSVADEASRPISEEFGYCWEQQNLGMSPEAALRELAHRTGLLELKLFVVAMMVHRQSGGNLAELLDKLAKVIRDRYRIRGQIKSLTAEGRFQAYILLGLPLVLLCVLGAINRSYMAVLFDFPMILVGMFVFEVVGAVWMRKIINFDF